MTSRRRYQQGMLLEVPILFAVYGIGTAVLTPWLLQQLDSTFFVGAILAALALPLLFVLCGTMASDPATLWGIPLALWLQLLLSGISLPLVTLEPEFAWPLLIAQAFAAFWLHYRLQGWWRALRERPGPGMHWPVVGVAAMSGIVVIWLTCFGITMFPEYEFDRAIRLYRGANDTPRDIPRALRLFRQGAERGHSGASYYLGYMLLKGEGTEPDPTAAAHLFLAAAKKGHGPSQYYLAQLYSSGQGVDADEAESARWMKAAAHRGISAAQYELARRLEEGIGVEQDVLAALDWYQKAAAQGFKPAQDALMRRAKPSPP